MIGTKALVGLKLKGVAPTKDISERQRRDVRNRLFPFVLSRNAALAEWSHKDARHSWGFESNSKKWRNWSGNCTASPAVVSFPESKQEVLELFEKANGKMSKLRFVGGSCSPVGLSSSDAQMVFTEKMNKMIWLDKEKKLVRVQSGMRFSSLVEILAEQELSFPILGSISDQTTGGAMATAVHGTGAFFPCLSAFVESFELITPTGEVLECSKSENPDLFDAGRCHLGALGFVSEITFRVESQFKLRSVQTIEKMDSILDRLPQQLLTHHHARYLWIPHTNLCLAWTADFVPWETPNKDVNPGRIKQDRFFRRYERILFFKRYLNCLGLQANKYISKNLFNEKIERIDRSDKIFMTECLYKQHVDEWILPASKLPILIRRMRKYLEKYPETAAEFPIEIRFQKGDDIWLSPAYNNKYPKGNEVPLASLEGVFASVGVITYRPYGRAPARGWKEWFKVFDDLAYELGGRPHWAKEALLTPDQLKWRYPRWNDFLELRKKLDPRNVLVNEWLQGVLEGVEREVQQIKEPFYKKFC